MRPRHRHLQLQNHSANILFPVNLPRPVFKAKRDRRRIAYHVAGGMRRDDDDDLRCIAVLFLACKIPRRPFDEEFAVETAEDIGAVRLAGERLCGTHGSVRIIRSDLCRVSLLRHLHRTFEKRRFRIDLARTGDCQSAQNRNTQTRSTKSFHHIPPTTLFSCAVSPSSMRSRRCCQYAGTGEPRKAPLSPSLPKRQARQDHLRASAPERY